MIKVCVTNIIQVIIECYNLLFQSYFEDNPRDLQVLRHDKSLHTVKGASHLKDVPDYLSKCILLFNILQGLLFLFLRYYVSTCKNCDGVSINCLICSFIYI